MWQRFKTSREAEAANQPTKNTSLQSFTPGDAKKGAGLFKVGILPMLAQQQKL